MPGAETGNNNGHKSSKGRHRETGMTQTVQKAGRDEHGNDVVEIRMKKIAAVVFLGWVCMRCKAAAAPAGQGDSYSG